MRYRRCAAFLAVVLLAAATPMLADHIRLKNGQEYSGKFIRGDASTIDFRILGRVESFRIAEVAEIIFKEPEMVSPPERPERAPVPREPVPPVREMTAPPPAREPAAAAPVPEPPSQPEPSAPAPESTEPLASLPEGTMLTVRTLGPIDTDRNRAGDSFAASLDEDVVVEGRTILARGTEIKGMISYAAESGKVAGRSELMLELTDVIIKGRNYPIRTSDYTEVGVSRGKRTAAAAGGGAVLGAIIGAIAGGGKGAAVGATTGAAAGTGAAVLTKGQVIKIPPETLLDFKLKAAAAVPSI